MSVFLNYPMLTGLHNPNAVNIIKAEADASFLNASFLKDKFLLLVPEWQQMV